MPRRRHKSDGYAGDRRSWTFGRSGWATALIIGVLLLSFGLLWRAHQRARFHQLTVPVIPQTTSAPAPGGQEAMLLSRVTLVNDSEPEFSSATVLPGIGMQVLQAVVAVPDRPTQNLLASVSASDAAAMPVQSVTSAPFHLRVSTRHQQEGNSGTDLIGFAAATGAANQTLVDGGQASGTFQASSVTDVTGAVEVVLSGRQIDLIAKATNRSEESRFVSFEWCPRFAAPDGENLDQLVLAIPAHSLPLATGQANPSGDVPGFTTEQGQSVGNQAIDLRFARLGRDFLSDGTSVQLENGDRFLLRISGLGDALRSLRVKSDPRTHTLLLKLSSLDLQADENQRDQTLRPGQTVQWHLRMEVLPAKTAQGPGSSH